MPGRSRGGNGGQGNEMSNLCFFPPESRRCLVVLVRAEKEGMYAG